MWHHSHAVMQGEDTTFLLDSASPEGRIPVGMLEIELSCRTGALGTHWDICPEGMVRNGKWLTTDKLLQKGQAVIAIPAQLLSQLLPVDRLESQCRFRREWQPSSLLSIPSAFAVMRISHVTSPVVQVPVLLTRWQTQVPRQGTALPADTRHGSRMWQWGEFIPCIQTGAACAPGKEWKKGILKENDIGLILPSSLPSLASPHGTICRACPTPDAARGELLFCRRGCTKKETLVSQREFWVGNSTRLDHSATVQKLDDVSYSLCCVACFHLPSTVGAHSILEDVFLLHWHLEHVCFQHLALKAKCKKFIR